MRMWKTIGIVVLAGLMSASLASAQKWQDLTHPPSFQTDTALMLTDGRVIVHEYNTPNWWALQPDNSGSYLNGTWKKLGSMPSDYAPLYFASQVLPDGRLLVEGGEYNFLQGVETNLGAIYDPIKDKWTNVNAPTGWSNIGDSPAVVLPNGVFMMGMGGFATTKVNAFFNPKSLKWTLKGTGKDDGFVEEGMALLPNGKVILVDTQTVPNSEIFDPKTFKWKSAGSTIVTLALNSEEEIGPELLRPDGTVFVMGANGTGAGHTAIYNSKTSKWAKGPDFPGGNDMADGPAAVLPDGNVLCETSPGVFNPPLSFYEFNGKKFTKAPTVKVSGSPATSYVGRFLVLPTGQILYTLADGVNKDAEIYTAKGTYKTSWAPAITNAPTSVTRGDTYKISGTQFNGLTHGSAYGDDAQMNSNYPLVRITNNGTSHVFYARTHDPSTMGVATGTKVVSTNFDVPASMETGDSTLEVVANGIPSAGVDVTVQ